MRNSGDTVRKTLQVLLHCFEGDGRFAMFVFKNREARDHAFNRAASSVFVLVGPFAKIYPGDRAIKFDNQSLVRFETMNYVEGGLWQGMRITMVVEDGSITSTVRNGRYRAMLHDMSEVVARNFQGN